MARNASKEVVERQAVYRWMAMDLELGLCSGLHASDFAKQWDIAVRQVKEDLRMFRTVFDRNIVTQRRNLPLNGSNEEFVPILLPNGTPQRQDCYAHFYAQPDHYVFTANLHGGAQVAADSASIIEAIYSKAQRLRGNND